ncbi:hypothetical protein I9W82_003308 [Candida metapsilosis]|uniref:Pre-mRNA-splicing factor SYF2 n=1 Tax=Candida metapsilosis TaxID=273372 RepID=A0A8H8DC52_9ASCO|nr:hypothetical protein I9W82_003308 [Candida metapsilosis]
MTSSTADSESLSSLLAKFDQLKSKRQDALRLNKADVAQETRRKKLASLQSKSNHYEADPRKSLSEHERVMEYTIEECDAWEDRRQRRMNTGIQDQDKLAEATYYKEINELKVDKEAYLKFKRGEASEGYIDDNLRDEVSNMVNDSKDRKFNKKRGRSDEDAGNFISEKNRQFNLKLNRQYD